MLTSLYVLPSRESVKEVVGTLRILLEEDSWEEELSTAVELVPFTSDESLGFSFDEDEFVFLVDDVSVDDSGSSVEVESALLLDSLVSLEEDDFALESVFPEEEESSSSELEREIWTSSGLSTDEESSPQAISVNGRVQQARKRAILCRPMFMGQIPPAFKYKKGLADSLCFPLKTEYEALYARNGAI
jgi:hypothetical protein